MFIHKRQHRSSQLRSNALSTAGVSDGTWMNNMIKSRLCSVFVSHGLGHLLAIMWCSCDVLWAACVWEQTSQQTRLVTFHQWYRREDQREVKVRHSTHTQERTHAQPDTNVNRNKGSSVQSQAEWYSKLKTQSLTDFLFFKSLVIVR